MDTQPATKSGWLAPTSLCLGILAFLFSPLCPCPYFFLNFIEDTIIALSLAFCLILGLAAVIIGSISLARKKGQRALSICGIVLGGVGLLSSLCLGLAFVWMITGFNFG